MSLGGQDAQSSFAEDTDAPACNSFEEESAGPTLYHQTPDTQTRRVLSKFYPPTQLKKGNKEPNPMVQLSVQDVTQESKVG